MRAEVLQSSVEAVSIDAENYVYLVYNEAVEQLLFDRNLVGAKFRNACFRASSLFIRHIEDEIVSREVTELLILSKGLVYQLGEAFAAELDRNLPVNVIATTRVGVDRDAAKIDVPYARFDAGGDVLLIGDTVASGSTLIATLEEYRQEHALSAVYVFSYAGTLVGARRIMAYCRTEGIESTLLYGLAAFGLGENGFDLSFTHPDTLSKSVYVERARTMYGDRAISAVGWDFGSQSMAPGKYRQLSWVESRLAGLEEGILTEVSRPTSLKPLWREENAFSARVEEIELEDD